MERQISPHNPPSLPIIPSTSDPINILVPYTRLHRRLLQLATDEDLPPPSQTDDNVGLQAPNSMPPFPLSLQRSSQHFHLPKHPDLPPSPMIRQTSSKNLYIPTPLPLSPSPLVTQRSPQYLPTTPIYIPVLLVIPLQGTTKHPSTITDPVDYAAEVPPPDPYFSIHLPSSFPSLDPSMTPANHSLVKPQGDSSRTPQRKIPTLLPQLPSTPWDSRGILSVSDLAKFYDGTATLHPRIFSTT